MGIHCTAEFFHLSGSVLPFMSCLEAVGARPTPGCGAGPPSHAFSFPQGLPSPTAPVPWPLGPLNEEVLFCILLWPNPFPGG